MNGDYSSRRFVGHGGGTEHYLTVEAPPHLDFAAQIEHIERQYAEACQELALPQDSAIFRRIFLSDVLNQAVAVRQSRLDERGVAVSLVQQPPLSGAKIAMLAYHVDSPVAITKQRLTPHDLLVEKNGLRHVWTTGLCAAAGQLTGAARQTRAVFGDLIGTLNRQGGNLRDNCVRTWLYLKDVDLFYQDMVNARSEVFVEQGLTADTHYIASTGIEGACGHQYDLVAMDAYGILGLDPRQMSYLNDFERLCPTKDYNVTFERGTRITYRDRSHLFISGTASIDGAGQVVHTGNVGRQLDRALENVEALLRSGGADLDDMMHLTVYLRDPSDFWAIDQRLRQGFPGVPTIIVEGAVCRPEWLVEIEGIAITPHDDPAMLSF